MNDFSNRKYVAAHGKEPRGTGQWAFGFGSHEYDRVIFWYGSLTAAKRAVAKKAKEYGYSGTIYVLP